ncbi:MAG TPA: PhzF family phenazine biosynthesis protein [Syntrophales bacterium]|nr:PhzF family phenazine biosynthesis protein [Syntrophales bacterium]HPQ43969.1 PhzF family phenazine biosynthesis protein [Syntrophales bacterium]
MKKFKFKKIDAFATQQSDGNPAGMVCVDSFNDTTTDELLRIAQELKGFVSEVGYVCQTDNTFVLKYYSSEREVDFCGHATIAIMYDLIQNSDKLINMSEIPITTKKGNLTVENRIAHEDAVFISAPDPVFSTQEIDPARIAEALRIKVDEIDTGNPISIVNAGLETLIVPIKTLQGILSISPLLDELKEFCVRNTIDIITVYTDEVAHTANTYRTRVFAPTFGYLEDPATGSGNSAFGYYLLNNKMWDGTFMSLEQNGSFEKPNNVKLMVHSTPEAKTRVFFGGGAIVRIDGKYLLP